MPPPPRWVRRLVLAPAVVLLGVVLLVTLPVWLVVGAATSSFAPGHLRPLRVLWLATVYVIWDAVVLLALFALWLASGFGWKKRSPGFQRAHYVLIGRFLSFLLWQVRWALRLRIQIAGVGPDNALPGRPQLVLCRHAGLGDSFVLIHALVNWFDREPRIVLRDRLQWDPAVDVMLHRLPNRFLATDSADRAVDGKGGPGAGNTVGERIGRLAEGLDDNDVFVIFPEGGNFTPYRRLRTIERLRARGLERMAVRAEAMRHVLAPHPGGVLAALEAAPDAGVTFVAHTGIDRMRTVADIWRAPPMDKLIVMHFWSVPREEVPAGRQERIEWLFDWWTRIDEWVDDNGRHTGKA